MLLTSLCAAVRKWEALADSLADEGKAKWANENLMHSSLKLATVEKRILDRQFWL